MQINKYYETEIHLKDLFIYLFYRWRSILAVALIGALLLGGYQYYSVKSTHDAGKLTKEESQYETDLQEYREELDRYQAVVEEYTRQLATLNGYQQDSVYYNLDANALWTARRSYLVVVDQSVLEKLPFGSTMDPADSILSAYSAPQAGEPDGQVLEDVFGTEKYYNELVKVSTDTTSNTVIVIVKGDSRERVEKEIEFLHTRIEAIAANQSLGLYPHTITLVSENIYFGPDSTLSELKAANVKDRNDTVKNLDTAYKKIEDLEKKGEPAKPGTHLVRQALFGFVLGAFLMVVLYFFLYLINGKLKSSREFPRHYSLPVFGEVIHSGSLHHGRTLDKLIQKWEHVDSAAAEDKVYDGVAALIREQPAEKVLLTGTVAQQDLDGVLEILKGKLGDAAEIAARADILGNADALTEAIQAPAVILVEKRNTSKQSDIRREAEMLIIGKANVVGAIVI